MRENRRQVRALVALNAALLLALAGVTLAPGALAQRSSDPAQRGRGEYTMVDAEIQGVTSSGIFIVDGQNRELVALSWDQSRKVLDILGYRDIDLDERQARGGGR